MTIDDRLDPTAAAAATTAPAPARGTAGAGRVAALASEFEAMLLTQMLKEMRQAGSWKDEEDASGGYDAEPLFDALHAELGLRLAKAQSLGLGAQLIGEVTHALDGSIPAGPAAGALEAPLPPAPASTGAPGPAADAAVTSGFGWRADPLTGAPAFHRGIDLRASYGETVAAAGPGRVVAAGTQGGYGQTVVVDHGGGLTSRYAHLSAIGVQVGDAVATGQEVGRAGRSGRATGTHVHFEASQGGTPVDPAEFPTRLKLRASLADVGTGSSDAWRRP